ncbi:hypothetical protein F4777DRAFT_569326 [Nemania sp. FL0916]|nr:hypothetical protein F4777DRAFT_569326 [Nemania sp. FL0916]
MLMPARLGGLSARWRQLSKLGKIVFVSIAIFFLLAVLWGTGTVDVDYVRHRFANTSAAAVEAVENHNDEPIPQQKTETPIIDGVPNDQNDRPIPEGVIEGGVNKLGINFPDQGEGKDAVEKQDIPAPSDGESNSSEKNDAPATRSRSRSRRTRRVRRER